LGVVDAASNIMADLRPSINATYGHGAISHNLSWDQGLVVCEERRRAIANCLPNCTGFVLGEGEYADMDEQLAQLERNIARIRRDIRIKAFSEPIDRV
jgi:hypothetical protein